jgi:hypothetical protein
MGTRTQGSDVALEHGDVASRCQGNQRARNHLGGEWELV